MVMMRTGIVVGLGQHAFDHACTFGGLERGFQCRKSRQVAAPPASS